MKLYWKIIIGVIAAIIIGGVAAYFITKPPKDPGVTVKEFEYKMTNELNKKLAEPGNEVRSAVQQMHNATTIRSLQITGITCTTVNKEKHVGKNGENIESIKARITAKWSNSTQPKGITVFQYEAKRSSDGSLISPSITVINTNAKKTNNVLPTDVRSWWEVWVTPETVFETTRLITTIIITFFK